MSAKQPLSLFELLLIVRNGGLAKGARTWAAKWRALGKHLAEHYPGALDLLDPTRHEFRPEALRLLRRCADGATVKAMAAELKELPTYVANGIRGALVGVEGELLAAAKLLPAEVEGELLAAAKLLPAEAKLLPAEAAGSDGVEWSREELPKVLAKLLRISRTTFYYRRYKSKVYRFRRVEGAKTIQIALEDLPEEAREKLRPRP
jgi:hypothetical protein